ncbi:MAG: hypothetical protein AAFR61_13205 [Bacteroidota bacterium]
MILRFLSLCLMSVMLLSSEAFGQRFGRNFTIQVGYQAKYLNPKPFNFVVDAFNAELPRTQDLSPYKWALGPVIGVGTHRGRSSIRLQGSRYTASSFGLFDDNGVEKRRDVKLSGTIISLSMMGELIPFNRESHFAVGASFSMAQFNTQSSEVPSADFQDSDPLTQVSNQWLPSFTILAPFRIGLGPQVKLSLEPYYQIFFSSADFSAFGENLVGNAIPSNDPGLTAELDHFGLTFNVMVFLRPR